MKITIKKYAPRPETLASMLTVLGEDYRPNDPIRMLAEDLRDLLAHHDEETKWLIGEIRRLELLTKD